MKTRPLVSILSFVFAAAVIFIFASCENGAVTPTFMGTWVNPDYDGTGSPAKTESTDNGDGTFTALLYDYVSDTVPSDIVIMTMTDQWTDSEGNLWCKVEGWIDGAEYVYELVKVHADNETMEVNMDDIEYPTEIDPTGSYAIYYRQ